LLLLIIVVIATAVRDVVKHGPVSTCNALAKLLLAVLGGAKLAGAVDSESDS
jgi:hypothetical protein